MTSTATTQQTRHKLPVRTLVAASVGNAVEWYDWTVFATFSIYFATQIFSSSNESAAFVGTFATYAVAFFFRPLGGMLLGRYADLRGRKQAMLLTIALMAGGSFVIAILPTFDQVGWLAPILLLRRPRRAGHVAGRRGVERVGVPRRDRPARAPRPLLVVLLHLHRLRRCSSRRCSARCSRATCPTTSSRHGAGAVPFVIGGLLGLVGLWLRKDMAETEQFEENKAKAQALRNPLMLTLREHPRAVAQLIGFTLLSTLCYYTFFSALTPFAVEQQKLDDGMVFWALSIATALFVALQYPFGWTADRFGRKPQMLIWSGADRAAASCRCRS